MMVATWSCLAVRAFLLRLPPFPSSRLDTKSSLTSKRLLALYSASDEKRKKKPVRLFFQHQSSCQALSTTISHTTHLLSIRTTGSHTTVGTPPRFSAGCTLHLYCTSSFSAHSLSAIGGFRARPDGSVLSCASSSETGIAETGGAIVSTTGNVVNGVRRGTQKKT